MRTTVPVDRALSKLGLATRTEARELIHAGRVRVNGTIVKEVGTRIKLDAKIQISGAYRTVKPAIVQRVVIAFNKPRGVVTTTSDPEGRPTVFGVLAEKGMIDAVHTVDHLDLASTGLLLLTSDSLLLKQLTDPVKGVERTYAVVVRGRVSPEAAESLQPGHAEIRKASGPETHLIVTLKPGKHREIRKMFEEIGHDVTRLHRVEYGPVSLEKLQPGDWMDVTHLFP